MAQSILKSVLEEELSRNKQKQAFFMKQLASGGHGYVYKKIIKGNVYLYVQSRKGKNIASTYLGRYSFEKLQEAIKQLEERNKVYQQFKFLKKEETILKKAIQAYDQ